MHPSKKRKISMAIRINSQSDKSRSLNVSPNRPGFIDKRKAKIIIKVDSSVTTTTMQGQLDDSLIENVPEFQARGGDNTELAGENNTLIWLGRDRWAQEVDPVTGKSREKTSPDPGQHTLVSGYSDHQGAGAIDIVTGRGAPYPPPNPKPGGFGPIFQTVTDPSINARLANGKNHDGFMMDASRIYLSQMCDIDRYFGIDTSQFNHTDHTPASAIMVKADKVRLHSRRDIKIVAGGDNKKNIDSNGYNILERPMIHLIGGNGQNLKKNKVQSPLGPMQSENEKYHNQQHPVVLGNNMITCIQHLYTALQATMEVVNSMLCSQMAMNTTLAGATPVNGGGVCPILPTNASMGVKKGFDDANNMFNIYFEKMFNMPTDQFNFLNKASASYILSRNVTVN
jgi:hypothetical protein